MKRILLEARHDGAAVAEAELPFDGPTELESARRKVRRTVTEILEDQYPEVPHTQFVFVYSFSGEASPSA